MGCPAGFDAEVGLYAERSSQQSVLANVPVPACAKLHPAGPASGAGDVVGLRAGVAAAVVIRSTPSTAHAHAATRQASPHSVAHGAAPSPIRLSMRRVPLGECARR